MKQTKKKKTLPENRNNLKRKKIKIKKFESPPVA
jgi:hypothetical protein